MTSAGVMGSLMRIGRPHSQLQLSCQVLVASLFLMRPQIPCMTKVLKCCNQPQSLSEMIQEVIY